MINNNDYTYLNNIYKRNDKIMENKRVKKRIRSIAAAAAAMSLALSFAYAEEIGIDRAGFGTAVTVSAANVVSERYCGDTYNGTNLDWVVATLYDDGRLVITGKKGYISNINAGRLCGFINDNVNQMNKINKIIIGDGITSVPDYCFNNCNFYSGVSIEIGSSVRKIGSYAFAYKGADIREVVFADNSSLETIDTHAFCSCAIEKIKIPDSVQTIEIYAFCDCYNLESVEFKVLKSKLESIGDNAFDACPKLKNLVIPNSVKTLGANWLSSVKGYIAYPEDLAGSIPASAVANAVSFEYKVDGNDVVLTGVKNPGETVTVPDFITVIGNNAFFNCSNIQSINIHKNVKSIGNNAFQNCAALSNMNFETGSKLNSIGEAAFYNCTALTSIDIPENVTKIGKFAFIDSGLKSINISKSVTDIGEGAFNGCKTLSDVTFEAGSKLSSIGEGTFYGCTALTRIDIPENLKKIGVGAFSGSGLKSITIPKNVVSIENLAFSNCKSLLNVDFEDGSVLGTIGEEAFKSCVKLTAIEIPDSVDTIDIYAFDSCESLEAVKLPENADLGKGAFSGCSSIKSIAIPSGILSIEDYLFRNCTSLRSIELHPDIAYVGEYSFDGCTALESIFIPSDVVPAANAVINTASKALYEIKDSKAYITEITLGDGRSDVAIPETICGFPVVFVDENSRRYVGAHTHVAEKEICTEGKICGICGNSYTTASGHDDSDSWKYDADNHWKICAREGCGEQIKLKAHTFDEGVVTTLPTEYSEGVRTYTCNTCGYEKTESIEKLNHTHKRSEKYAYDETEHWKTCTECNEKLDPEKHSFDEGVVTTEPTEYSEGVMTYTCAVCGYEKTESIEKSDHTHKPSQKYAYDETEHWKTCTECSEKLDPEKHSFDEGVVTTQPTTESEGVRTYTCTVCGYEKTESIEKLPDEPVKTYPIVISGDVSVSKSGASAGETVDVSAPFGYDIIVTDGSGRQIAKITDKGSFIMPASGVRITAVRGEIFAHMTNAWSHSYVYSYDSDMNRIKVNSDVKRGVVTIDLGVNYAGRSFTVYSGRKSTSKKITEGVLDENGRYTFSYDEGRNYTLVLD